MDSFGNKMASSPAMSFEEMARTIAEEWEKLPEESKTPYRERADEECLRHEAMSAALVLTQIGTPPLRSSVPVTPVPRSGQKARRCLDIGTSDWQSPRAPPHPDDSSCLGYHDEFDFDPDLGDIFTDAQALLGDTDDNCRSHMLARSRRRNGSEKGVDDEDDNGTGQASSLVAGSLASSSPALPPSAFSPLPPGPNDAPHPSNHTGSSSVNKDPENSRRPRHRTTRLPSSTKLAAGTSLRTPGRSERDGGGGGSSSGSMGLVGLEVRAVDGAEESLSEEKTLDCGSWGRAKAPKKSKAAAAAVPAGNAASRKKRKTSSSPPPFFSPAPVSSSSSFSSSKRFSSSSASLSWSTAAAAAAQKNGKNGSYNQRSEERTRKAECKAGRKLVSKMSKKDAARPKGPQSSYIWFYKERMTSMKAAKPRMTIMEMGTAVGEAWRGLSKDMKIPYTERAEADRKRYERELRAIARNAVTAVATPAISASNASNDAAAASATCSTSAP